MTSWECPTCRSRDLMNVRDQDRIREGWLRKPHYLCGKCGHHSERRIDLRKAIVALPLTAIFLVLILAIVLGAPSIGEIRKNFSLVYGILSGCAIGIVISVGLRSSFSMYPIPDEDRLQRQE